MGDIDLSKRHYLERINGENETKDARSEQFRQWARAVWAQMQELGKGTYVDGNGFTRGMLAVEVEEVYIGIMARAGYDLVAHTLWHTAVLDLERLSIGENVERIPDMAELPKEIQDV